MVPSGRTIIYIGYKYNMHKFLSFIFLDTTGSTQVGLSYLSKYPEHFSNVEIIPVTCPLFISKFFGAVNEVDSNK